MTVKIIDVKEMNLADLTPADYNPRRISDDAMSGLRASIRQFGLVDPIILNTTTGNVVGGHQRIKAAIAEGLKKGLVVRIEADSTEEKALNVALNNPKIQGEFDYLKLEPIMLELKEGLGDLVLEELKMNELISPIPQDLKEYDESIADDVKKIKCPECGYEFPI